MIVCKMGLPGAGKSYTGCQDAKMAAEAGRYVITNMPLKLEAWPLDQNVIVLPFNGWAEGDEATLKPLRKRLRSVLSDEAIYQRVLALPGPAFSSVEWFEAFLDARNAPPEDCRFMVPLADGSVAGPVFILDEVGVVWGTVRFGARRSIRYCRSSVAIGTIFLMSFCWRRITGRFRQSSSALFNSGSKFVTTRRLPASPGGRRRRTTRIMECVTLFR